MHALSSIPKSQCDVGVSNTSSLRNPNRQHLDRIYQFARIALLGLVGIGISCVAFRWLFVPIVEYAYPESHTHLLDSGIYGAYPLNKYLSTTLTSPQANAVVTNESCAGGLVLLSIGGLSVTDGGPMILDMAGNLVWSAPGEYGDATANTKIQRYRGQDYLTFWAGEKLQESGLGSYYMLDSTYDVVYEVSAVGENVEGDLHEFKITEDGSALITVYERVFADLKDTNIQLLPNQTIVDGIMQEIDIATGELLFEWRSSEHLEHPALQTSSGGSVADGSLDYFHMNSIDKDSRGNYLISLRHLHTLVYVEGISGQILWTLGSEAGDFDDLSHGDATGFLWQHDARWISEEDGIISLFDNGIAHKHHDAAYSQGLIIQLDFFNWTATLLQEYTSRDLIGSASQGDVQLLQRPNADDHVFIGWGASAAFTEHSIDGTLLCETHFGAAWLFYFERVKSYRASKTFDWKATPAAWDPQAQIVGDEIYVSWNGATEVAYWLLQARDEVTNTTYEEVFPKGNEFESTLSLPWTAEGATYRIAALDAHQDVIRYSNEIAYMRARQTLWISSACLLGLSLIVICSLLYSRRATIFQMWKERSENRVKIEYHALDHYEPV